MNDILQRARAICHTLLNGNIGEMTDKLIFEAIDKVAAINIVPGQVLDKRELFEILSADFSIGKGEISMLTDELDHWLDDAKGNINFELWNRYRLHLKESDPSFPINDLDDFSDKILDKCVNPKKSGAWDRRGMVVGHVQSGKTSNYVGLINKATDAGYKVIIIIAGTIGSLRRQTQERIDLGYIGRSSSAYINNSRENRVVGVGKYPVDTDIYSLTSSAYRTLDEGDFNQAVANRLNFPIGNNPIVFVIKKNKSILENLIDWFSKNAKTQTIDGFPKLLDVPVLIIDDEADSASVNATNDIKKIKTINKLIRVLLNIFNQKTFIGYTATPFANLFISQEYDDTLTAKIKGKEYKIGEDLFPRDFIINLKAPTNYIGAATMFGYEDPKIPSPKEPLNIFRGISDFDPPFFGIINKDNRDDLPNYLPKSLERAIKTFIITCAIRRLRGHETKHNSMLVHVALLVKWIDRVALLVNEKTREYKNAIQSDDAGLLEELRIIYEEDFIPTTKNVLESLEYKDIRIAVHSWNDVKKELKRASSKLIVRAVHGTKSTAKLEYHNIEEIDFNQYKDGLSVIAVGGSRLSRGITLEGLSISYYIRTTKMYDSLMQMGRWFGYRPGYVDLCRIFTTSQIYEWFNHITSATEEMRNDFDELTASLNRPKDYRLKVRNHHGLLTITSITRMNFSKNIEISFSGSNLQTYQLLKTKSAIENNFKAFKSLINYIGFPEVGDRKLTAKGKYKNLLYFNQSIDPICEFIDNFKIDQPSIKNATISEYLKKQKKNHKISGWNICIVNNTDEKVFIDYLGNTLKSGRKSNEKVMTYELNSHGETIELGCSVRNQPLNSRQSSYYLISKNQIDDLGDRQIDLGVNDLATNNEIKAQRKLENKGLLLIYALDERATPNVKNGVPIIGFSIYFPIIDNEEKVSYSTTTNDNLDNEGEDDDPENA